jgi:hypothetical protein
MAGHIDQEFIPMSTQPPVDPATNASLFILQDNIHEPMHDRFLWAIRQRRDHLAKAIPEWEELREIASKIKEHTLTHPRSVSGGVRMQRNQARRSSSLGARCGPNTMKSSSPFSKRTVSRS